MDNRITAIVAGWSPVYVERQADYIEQVLGIKAMRVVEFNHEAKMINKALDAVKTPYAWYVEPDVNVSLYPDCPMLMADLLDDRKDIGLVRPNREGEPPRNRIMKKYLDDGTAWMFRLETGVRWDEDFVFSGWGDLDFGEEVVHKGFLCVLDERRSVEKEFTSYGSWNTYRWATVWRNRLLLEVKWYWVGIENWKGVDWYNDLVEPERRIPTMFELAGYTDDQLEMFSESIDKEHPQIRFNQLGHGGNPEWKRPW